MKKKTLGISCQKDEILAFSRECNEVTQFLLKDIKFLCSFPPKYQEIQIQILLSATLTVLTSVQVYVCACMCVHKCACICVHVCVYVCMHVYVLLFILRDVF